MELKYVVLDEIELKLLTDFEGNTALFNDKNLAISCAETHCVGWQIIEVPFAKESNDNCNCPMCQHD